MTPKNIAIILSLLVFGCGSLFAQEICDNGIDDDFDGQIDINDDDCLCLSPGVNIVENSSFESYTMCPTASAQGVTATDWINGGLGTADYFNLCANCCTPFTFPGPPMPLPTGAGVMGFANSDGWNEFFGQCLTTSLPAGQKVTVEAKLGFVAAGIFDLGVFGSISCTNLPAGTVECPGDLPDWVELGKARVVSTGAGWYDVTFDFVTPTQVEAIVVGTACSTASMGGYHYIDDFMMFPVGLPVNVFVLDNCPNVDISTPFSFNETYQWYYDGIAIIGETNIVLSVTPDQPGEYQLMVTNGLTCGISPLTLILEFPELEGLGADVIHIDCFGDATGEIEITTPNGVAPFEVTWDHGPVGNPLQNLEAGIYTATVTDSYGCENEFTTVVTEPFELTGLLVNIIYPPGDFATSTVGAFGGVPSYTFEWDNGETGQTATMLLPGIHEVTITDGMDCETIVEVIIVEGLSNISNITNESCFESCDGAIEIMILGGTAPYDILWSNDSTSTSINTLCNGKYYVTITDDYGAEYIDSFEVLSSPAIQISEIVQDASCFEGSNGFIFIEVMGGVPDYTFNWSNDSTSKSIEGLASGIYSLTVTDLNLCSAEGTWIINEPIELSFTDIVTQVECNGNTTGSIDVTGLGGTKPYSFLWEDNSTSSLRNNLAAGNYALTITDINLCKIEAEYTIDEPDPLVIVEELVSPACSNNFQGSIEVNVSGGVFDYEYLWSNMANGASIMNVPAGDYSLTVTDGQGCELIENYTLQDNVNSNLVDAVITHISCQGIEDGTIDLSLPVANGPYTFIWNTNDETEDMTGLSPGIYTVTITDNIQCESYETYEIIDVTSLMSDSIVVDIDCFGGNNGSITLIPSGATPDYTFLWNNNETTIAINNLIAGNYDVTITDDQSCSIELNFTLSEPDELTGSVLSVTPPQMSGVFGSAEVFGSGGTLPYTYLWENGEMGPIAQMLNLGIQTVTISDLNGCETVVTVNLPAELLTADFNTQDNLCFGDCNGELSLSIAGGLSPYDVMWSDNQTGDMASGLCNGVYEVTITDQYNQEVILQNLEITSPDPLSMTQSVIELSCYDSQDASIEIEVSGGTQPMNYSWNIAGTDSIASNLNPGVYEVEVTDAFGCTLSANFEIVNPPLINATYEIEHPICEIEFGTLLIQSTNEYDYPFTLDGQVYSIDQIIPQIPIGTHTLGYQISDNCFITIGTFDIIEQFSDISIEANVSVLEFIPNSEIQIAIDLFGAEDGYSVLWEAQDEVICEAFDDEGECVSIQMFPTTNQLVNVTLVDAQGCVAETSVELKVLVTEIYVPNVFSPNGDGVNETFKLFGNEMLEGINEMYVFNRWGERIYSELDKSIDDFQGWDGKYKGTPVDPGVYVYMITASLKDGQIQVFQGDVSILK